MSTPSVLVIEDDDFVRQTLVAQLRQMGITRVDEASDGAAARRALEGTSLYQFILADVMLPNADVVQLLRTTSAQQRGAGLILMSALGAAVLRSVAVLCRERGQRVLGAIRKPVRAETLIDLIKPPAVSEALPATSYRAATIDDLHRALELRAIGTLVQPKVSAADGSLHGVEFLAHWEDKNLGKVPSGRLVRLADDAGLGAALLRYMVSAALRRCVDWKAAGLFVPVSVNLGHRVLQDLETPDVLDRMLRTHELQPEMLTLEVAEHPILDHADALDVLSRLRMRGMHVALDNFGTGQASALRMQRLPVSELKIDPGFVRCLPGSSVATAVVEYGVRLARSLSITTTAVGVENEAQAGALRALGCDRLQGYWISRPIPPDDLQAWSQSRKPVAATIGSAP